MEQYCPSEEEKADAKQYSNNVRYAMSDVLGVDTVLAEDSYCEFFTFQRGWTVHHLPREVFRTFKMNKLKDIAGFDLTPEDATVRC